jgi:4-aminobutyrate aminotransferase
MALTTSKTIYKAGFAPLMPGDYVTSFPYVYHAQKRYGKNYTEDQCVSHALEDLEVLLHTQSAPGETCALLIEPVLGEGGYVPAPKSFMQGLREISKKNNILLIVDEVQSGFGRTGTYFTFEQSNITPDIVIYAKGVASGLPLSGIVSTQELMSKQPAGSMGGTYAGNAVSCAAAVATLEVFQKENILQNVQERSKQLFSGLLELKRKYSNIIGDVRGLGLMVAVEFDYKNGQIASKVSKNCLANHLMLLTCSVFDTIRFIPPLTVTQEEITIALNTFEQVLKQIEHK